MSQGERQHSLNTFTTHFTIVSMHGVALNPMYFEALVITWSSIFKFETYRKKIQKGKTTPFWYVEVIDNSRIIFIDKTEQK